MYPDFRKCVLTCEKKYDLPMKGIVKLHSKLANHKIVLSFLDLNFSMIYLQY